MLENFLKAYNQLNEEQKEAVDTIEGPVMVIAGPGTGKTQVLTLRIANILRLTDTSPENILALTFTDAAGQNMKERLAEIIGPNAYRVQISTFHSFCEKIINDYPEYFSKIIGSRVINEIKQVEIIEKIIFELPLNYLRPSGDPYYYIKKIVSLISELKREGINPDLFKKIIEEEIENFKGNEKDLKEKEKILIEKNILKNKDLALIYERYQKEIQEQKFYDFDDMLLEVLDVLENEEDNDLLKILQETYQYVLVDEHQDTNNAQNKILQKILSFHPNPNIFVVGDEKQAIFRFQGASLENFNYFRNLYPQAKIIYLVQNYRSVQEILDSAEDVIKSHYPLVAQKRCLPKKKAINVFYPSSYEKECYVVAKKIEELINQNCASPEEIAVLYRKNDEASLIADFLKKLNIPYYIASDYDVFSEPIIRKFLHLLRVLDNPYDDIIFADFLHLDFLKIHPFDVLKLVQIKNEKNKNFLDIISSKKIKEKYEWHNFARIQEVSKLISLWIKIIKNENFLTAIEKIFYKCGIFQEILESDQIFFKMELVNNFFNEIQVFASQNPDVNLKEFLKYLDTGRRHGLFLRHFQKPPGSYVKLMTVHRAKGLEFDYVFIIHASEKNFGPKRIANVLQLLPSVYKFFKKSGLNQELESQLEDERKLFYVALTRARKEVFISCSEYLPDGKNNLPSPFILQIRKELLNLIDNSKIEETFNDLIFKNALNQELNLKIKNKEEFRIFIEELFKKNMISPTAFDNYLECPWKYFYQNLIRIPSVQTKEQNYGTAVHEAIADMFKRAPEEEINEEVFLSSFKNHLFEKNLTPRERDDLLKRGEKSLPIWFRENKQRFYYPGKTELEVKGIPLNEKIMLRGKIDRIEFSKKGMRVIDFKTSKPKSKNEILGKTKNKKSERYFHQLVFYKILLENFDNGKYDFSIGEINFTEPNKNNKCKKVDFEITRDHIDEIKKMIKQMAEDILNLSFVEKGCNQKDCRYCQLKEFLLN